MPFFCTTSPSASQTFLSVRFNAVCKGSQTRMSVLLRIVKASIILLALLLATMRLPAQSLPQNTTPIRIGSKAFTESVILGEILKQRVSTRFHATHTKQLGGTRILWNALRAGEIDAYPEYTGTIRAEILAGRNVEDASDSALHAALHREGIEMSAPLGFANTYAIGMRSETAQKLGIRTISDLARFPDLHAAFSNEFMDRHDGWRGLRTYYALPHKDVRGLEHDIAYRALADGTIDFTELYSTDAEIAEYNLTILQDDRHFFPDYRCVVLHRNSIPPEAASTLALLEGRISQKTMTQMNAEAKLRKTPEERIAARFLQEQFRQTASPLNFDDKTLAERVLARTAEHLRLTAVSLCAAILVAVPLGVIAARFRRVGAVVVSFAGIVQTIPSLALLVMMIPLFGIGAPPAMLALFLYSLLPIIRSTMIGITTIPPSLTEAAQILGASNRTRLFRIELPLAAPVLLSGIKTAAVINVGTATLGAIIGAGGHGQPILTGIRLADTALILEGAVPAAFLALAVQWLFDTLEHGFGRFFATPID